MKVMTVGVAGMTCQNCVRHVTEALTEVPGVHSVTVSLEENSATLAVDEVFDPAHAAEALDEAGYTLSEAGVA